MRSSRTWRSQPTPVRSRPGRPAEPTALRNTMSCFGSRKILGEQSAYAKLRRARRNGQRTERTSKDETDGTALETIHVRSVFTSSCRSVFVRRTHMSNPRFLNHMAPWPQYCYSHLEWLGPPARVPAFGPGRRRCNTEQTGAPTELIVVDDGSRDETASASRSNSPSLPGCQAAQRRFRARLQRRFRALATTHRSSEQRRQDR